MQLATESSITHHNSIDFIIKSCEEVESLGRFLPQELTLEEITMFRRSDRPCSPTIVYDQGAKTTTIENTNISVEKVVIEFSDSLAVTIPCTKEEELGLRWTTKQCFGFTCRGNRCKNRRSPTDRHAWCHHHILQKNLYDSNVSSSIECFVPRWW